MRLKNGTIDRLPYLLQRMTGYEMRNGMGAYDYRVCGSEDNKVTNNFTDVLTAAENNHIEISVKAGTVRPILCFAVRKPEMENPDPEVQRAVWQESVDTADTILYNLFGCMLHVYAEDVVYLITLAKLRINEENENIIIRIASLIRSTVPTFDYMNEEYIPVDYTEGLNYGIMIIDRKKLDVAMDKFQLHVLKANEWNGNDPENFNLGKWMETRGWKYQMDRFEGYETYYCLESSDTYLYHDCSTHMFGMLDCSGNYRTFEDWVKSHEDPAELVMRKEHDRKVFAEFNLNKPSPGKLRSLMDEEKLPPYEDMLSYGFETEQICNRTREPKQFVLTGFYGIDDNHDHTMHGIPRGGVTILAARTSAGKSSFLSSLKANVLAMGYSVYEVNAEESMADVADSLERNFAGRSRIMSPAPGCFEVTKEDAVRIWSEVRNRYTLYDNNKGFSWERIDEHLCFCCERACPDLIIIDDLIMMDTACFSRKNFSEDQSVGLMRRLHEIAQHYGAAVIVVAHPRKTSSLQAKSICSMSDILGSTVLTALSDLCLTLHRVQRYDKTADGKNPGIQDFLERVSNSPDYFMEKPQEIEDYDRVIEHGCNAIMAVVKNRYGAGSKQYFFPLYYTREDSKYSSTFDDWKPYDFWQKELKKKIACA